MIIKKLATLLIIISLLSLTSPYDDRLEKYYQILLEHKSEIKNVGDVLEVLIRDKLEKQLPERFEVLGNMRYYGDKRQLGEIDVIVLYDDDKPINYADFISEAKLWKNQKAALQKALEQLDRFATHLRNGTIRYMFIKMPDGTKRYFQPEQFLNPEYTTWGAKNATKVGFTYEFDITVEEGKDLFNKVRNSLK